MLRIFFISVCIVYCSADYINLHFNYSKSFNEGPGKSLFLTPLIESGKIETAQSASKVKPFLKDIRSYAGYLTVDKRYNSNLFFWFFLSRETDWNTAPVAVWLQGGPGSSSLFGLFLENGPYVMLNGQLNTRFYSWNFKCNILYIDNPVGTGFSFTDHDDGYARNQTIIGQHLYEAVKQFFQLFPNLKNNNFFIAGESYAGKYVPALAYTIHKNNRVSDFKINLQGLFIGNGLTDPINMLKYGDYLYQVGLIDIHGLAKFHRYESEIAENIKNKKWNEATELYGKLVLGYYYYNFTTLFNNITGINQHFNYVVEPKMWDNVLNDFVDSDLFRRAVHVGNKTFNKGDLVASNLKEDILKSVIDWVAELLESYTVWFYNGQLDIICAYPLTVNFLENMNWKYAKEYAGTPRKSWKIGSEVAGYYRYTDNLVEVMVRNAGHLVPSDQPILAYSLFNSFLHVADNPTRNNGSFTL